MGYETDWKCDLTITPALNEAEIEFLNAFFEARHEEDAECYEQDGTTGVDVPSYPGYWCNFEIPENGESIDWNGNEKTYELAEWLTWVTDQYLSEHSSLKDSPKFKDFTFNHVVEGTMLWAGEDRGDNGILYITPSSVKTFDQERLLEFTKSPVLQLDKDALKFLFQTAQILGVPGTEKNEASKKLYQLIKGLNQAAKEGKTAVQIELV